ncbi:hypothetical protein IG631_07268 [Alternaria alternata]|nr:hypothetical protein IG631_07268 [Alternaria alternata]
MHDSLPGTSTKASAGLPSVATGPSLDPCPPWMVQAGEWWVEHCLLLASLSALFSVSLARPPLHLTTRLHHQPPDRDIP